MAPSCKTAKSKESKDRFINMFVADGAKENTCTCVFDATPLCLRSDTLEITSAKTSP